MPALGEATFSAGRLRLSSQDRTALLEGKAPRITLPGNRPCPVAPGYTYQLSSRQGIRVHRTRRGKRGEWVIEYIRYDHRDRYLTAAAPRVLAGEEEEARHWTEDQEHGYVASRNRALAGAPGEVPGQALSATELEDIRRDAGLRWAEHQREERAEELARQQMKQLTNRLRRLQQEAARYGVDLSPRLAAMIREAEQAIADARSSEDDRL